MTFGKKHGLYDAGRIVYLPVSSIAPNPDQPRRDFDRDALRELSASIMRYGVLQPLTVRKRDGGGYELIAGERRLRAAVTAGLKEVPCIVLDVNSAESSVLALVENLQRRDLDFIEEARGLRRLITVYGFSQEEVARRVGRSQPAVANKLRLLRLPEETLCAIKSAGLSERHARALLRLEDAGEREAALAEIVRRGLNVADTETYIDGLLSGCCQPQQTRAKPMYVLKDVRLFLNTVARGMNMMRDGGVDAEMSREDGENGIVLTIRIAGTRK